MAGEIKLVRGDNRPYIKIRLYNSDGSVLDISDASITVQIRFRSVTSEITITTLSTTKLNDGTAGEVRFNFPGSTIDVAAGYYEGEVVVLFGSETQTVYDRLKFIVREKFEVA